MKNWFKLATEFNNSTTSASLLYTSTAASRDLPITFSLRLSSNALFTSSRTSRSLSHLASKAASSITFLAGKSVKCTDSASSYGILSYTSSAVNERIGASNLTDLLNTV